MARLAKLLGAFLLLVSLCVPLSTCTVADPPPADWPEGKPLPTHIQNNYAWTPDRWDDPAGYLDLLAFTWPAAAIAIATQRRLRKIFWIEPVLFAGSAWIVWELAWNLGDPAIGAYLSTVGLLAYGVGWIAEARGRLKPG